MVSNPRLRRRSGVTVVELLVVIAIIGLLVALILPAIQAAREGARKTQCRNNLRQIGVAVHNHIDAHGHYPTNGWGFLWMGDPDRGYDERQPGGWIYNTLPYLEQSELRQRGRGDGPNARRATLAGVMRQEITTFKCPSRPVPSVGLVNPELIWRNADAAPLVARTDYAINEGDYITHTLRGPVSLAEGDSGSFPWVDTTPASGVSFQRSRVTPSSVSDGLSNTFLAGEKYVSVDDGPSSIDLGHDQPMYTGVDLDINRWTIDTPLQDTRSTAPRRFGSAHAGGCHFLFCDGGVKSVSYHVDYAAYRSQGNRHDGL